MIQGIKQIFLSSQKQNNLKKVKCPKGNQATSICISDCTHQIFICNEYSCICLQNHSKCSSYMIKAIIKQLNNKKQKGQQVKQFYLQSIKLYQQILSETLQMLYLLKDQLKLYSENLILTQNQTKVLQFLKSQQNYKKLSKDDFKNIFKNQIRQIQNTNFISQHWIQYKQQFQLLVNKMKNNFFKTKSLNYYKQQLITKEDQILLSQWIQQETKKTVFQFKLLYKASQNDFSVQKFHQNCDQIHNTLVILKTEKDRIIGGFNPQKWKPQKFRLKQDKTKTSFIFSLTLKEKYRCIKHKESICCGYDVGPQFGGQQNQQGQIVGCDIAIFPRANKQKTSFINFPTSYEKSGSFRNITQDQKIYQLLSGQSNGHHFLIKQWEVYQIKFHQN